MNCRLLVINSILLLGVLAVLPSGLGGFIRVNNRDFVDEDCNEFLFSGYNTFQIVDAAADVCCGGKKTVDQQLDLAKYYNLTVIRMFAFPVLDGFNLQIGPNMYNETAFRGLDYVIAAAGKRELKLIIALSNNWMYNPRNSDTKCAYTNWTTSAYDCDDFFTDPLAIQLFNGNSRTIVNRINTYNNITYKNDPTILAWNLMNEPRCQRSNCHKDLQYWIESVAPFLKKVDPNHLITVGEDGFYQPPNCQSNYANPVKDDYGGYGQGWPLHTGQDFVPNHAPSSIDFLSVHLWPDNWARTDLDFGKAWLRAHMLNTETLGKPLVLEEFGKAATTGTEGNKWSSQTPKMRDDYYKLVYAMAERSLLEDTGLKGILFWRWDAINTGKGALGDFDVASSIRTNSTTFRNVILPFSYRTAMQNKWNKKRVPNCTPLSGEVQAASIPQGGGRRLAQASVGIGYNPSDPFRPARPITVLGGAGRITVMNGTQDAPVPAANPQSSIPIATLPSARPLTTPPLPNPTPSSTYPAQLPGQNPTSASSLTTSRDSAEPSVPLRDARKDAYPESASPAAVRDQAASLQLSARDDAYPESANLVGNEDSAASPQVSAREDAYPATAEAALSSGDAGYDLSVADDAMPPATPVAQALGALMERVAIPPATAMESTQSQAGPTTAVPSTDPSEPFPEDDPSESLQEDPAEALPQAGASESLPQQLPGVVQSTDSPSPSTIYGVLPERNPRSDAPVGTAKPRSPLDALRAATTSPAAAPAAAPRRRPPGARAAVVTQTPMAELNANITCRPEDFPAVAGRMPAGR